ncbi:MAG TPA: nucleotidyltransferase domain-containing protein [Oscillospiraceae bacterium]|nr:nucleotidyltransferase domain-containing protein [Oscillospiraceae bacterium]
MRLSDIEVNAIKQVVKNIDRDANIYLFGSRVDDDKKGGDIDLLILSHKLEQRDSSKIKYKLWDIIGEQRIDIFITEDITHPFARIALKEGILL